MARMRAFTVRADYSPGTRETAGFGMRDSLIHSLAIQDPELPGPAFREGKRDQGCCDLQRGQQSQESQDRRIRELRQRTDVRRPQQAAAHRLQPPGEWNRLRQRL